jgi:hypothetical protein
MILFGTNNVAQCDHSAATAERIGRLWRLNEVPEMPKENDLVSKGEDLSCRLNILRENEIPVTWHLCLPLRDDSLKAMAVCVEQHFDGKGITIRIASNTGDLSVVTNGFSMLAKTLEQAARRSQ